MYLSVLVSVRGSGGETGATGRTTGDHRHAGGGGGGGGARRRGGITGWVGAGW